ncbi:hypothetical protein [Stenotrophomonas maltophilia]|uniref:Uncharacterized protein n=1 Tax=Stenotrophomonas maltophilia TaxID=40324 RepID=A0A246I2Y1_STEMA|nr:hypothetical protein [Stenotrophomonas maltophilia]MCU1203977.1 hypothetical protein [Stenotrophomonas maltophilia]OWQ71866.1 hypothetical protein CEE63_15600 [Stenotrophomonas maltophilia]
MAPRSGLDTTLGELRAQLRAAGSPAGSDLDYRAWQVQLVAVEGRAEPDDIAYLQGRAQAILGQSG